MEADPTPAPQGAESWSLALAFEGAELRTADPVAECLRAIAALPELAQRAEALQLVLAELYSNALEHGVLGCDSRLKDSARGFRAYYELRASALERLDSGHVAIELSCERRANGGRVTITVTDSGPGFAPSALPDGRAPRAWGFGLALVRAHCESLEHLGCGNSARATLTWRGGADSGAAA